MDAGAVTYIQTYVINVTVVVVIVAQYIAYLNAVRRYGRTECGDLSCIMRQTDSVVVRIDIRYESGAVKSRRRRTAVDIRRTYELQAVCSEVRESGRIN